MGGHRRHRADRERMLGKPTAPDRREFGHAWRALVAEFGMPSAKSLARMAMMRAATRWVALVAAERALADARRERAEGKGRRPSVQRLNALAKRAGLEDDSYQKALDKLREIAGVGLGPAPTLDAIRAKYARLAATTDTDNEEEAPRG
jgi:hypothetical protein